MEIESDDRLAIHSERNRLERSSAVDTLSELLNTEFNLDAYRNKNKKRELHYVGSGTLEFPSVTIPANTTTPITFTSGTPGYFDSGDPQRIKIPAGVNLVKITTNISRGPGSEGSYERQLIRRVADSNEILAIRQLLDRSMILRTGMFQARSSDIIQFCIKTGGYTVDIRGTNDYSRIQIDSYYQEPIT